MNKIDWSNKETVLEKIKEDGLFQTSEGGRGVEDNFLNADDVLRADREFVLKAVSLVGEILKSVDDSFKSDKEIVMAAIIQNGSVLEFASESLKSDKNFLLEVAKLKINPHNCYYLEDPSEDPYCIGETQFVDAVTMEAPKEVWSDKEFCLEFLAVDGGSLYMVDDSLQADREIVLTAIKQFPGYGIDDVHDSLKSDDEIKKIIKEQENK